MTRNKELIEKYKRHIMKAEKEILIANDISRIMFLEGKITAYKFIIIDLQE